MTRAFEQCFKYTDMEGSPIEHGNVYQRERTKGPERTVFAPSTSCRHLIREFVASLPEPVFILFILSVTRRGRKPGRYQSNLLSIEEVTNFLIEFGEFLDRDARHELWIGTPDGLNMIVWDAHQLVYAYGNLESFEAIAQNLHLSRGNVEITAPHRHEYHQLFDDTEEEILDRFQWQWSPLQECDP